MKVLIGSGTRWCLSFVGLFFVCPFVGGCKENTINQTNINTINNITQDVGAKGAVVKHPSGAELQVPPGALTENVAITLGEVSDKDAKNLLSLLPAKMKASGPVIAFTPHGQLFSLASTIAVPFVDSGSGKVSLLRLAAGGSAWSELSGITVDPKRVSGETKTFSYYVVAQSTGAVDAGAPDLKCETAADCDSGIQTPDAQTPDARPPDAPSRSDLSAKLDVQAAPDVAPAADAPGLITPDAATPDGTAAADASPPPDARPDGAKP